MEKSNFNNVPQSTYPFLMPKLTCLHGLRGFMHWDYKKEAQRSMPVLVFL
jgi:hypothetical protein